MRCYTQPHQFDGGIDLHARTMYRCLFNQDGEVVLHRNMRAAPEPFLRAMAPYREARVVGVACLFTWYWLADLGPQEGLPFVLGHALDLKALPGGKAKNAKIDAHKLAGLLRGGLLPQASVYPAERRATRERLRRRRHLTRQRAELRAHLQTTNSQSNLPAIRKQLAYKAHRDGVAERCADPAVQKRLAVELALLGHDDGLRTDLELARVQTAQAHAAQTCYRVRSSPGVGKLPALVLLDDIHASRRFPRVQEGGSDGRLVNCAKESAGKRSGPSGKKMGKADRQWAFSDAAVLFLRHNPAGQTYLTRFAQNHGKGNAVTILAHQLARAVYDRLKRDTAFELDQLLRKYGSGAGGPAASLAAEGIRLAIACWQP
jgi:hypothetical protein